MIEDAPDITAEERPQGIGEAAIGSMTSSTDGQLEDNQDRAADMAEAGDPERTQAANLRLSAKAVDEYIAAKDTLPEKGKARRNAERQLYDSHSETKAYLRGRDPDKRRRSEEMTILENLPYVELDEENRDYYDKRVREMRKEAESHDEHAERLEEWAAILHDHPVSESYQQEHSDITFTPISLVRMENMVKDGDEALEQAEAMADELEEKGELGARVHDVYFCGEASRVGIDKLIYFIEGPSSDGQLHQQYQELKRNKETTLGQIGSFHAELIKRGVIDPIFSVTELTRDLLERVRSGQLSENPQESSN